MSDKEAQVNWDDDGRDIEQLRAELAQAQRQLATTVQRCGYCDYRATGADAFNIVAEHIKSCPKHPLAETLVELAQAREELVTADAAMDAVQALWRSPAEVERQDVNLAQACAELKDLQGANRAYEQQLKNLISSGSVANGNRDFWFETCHEAEAERDKARKEAQAQSDLVQHDWLSPCQKAGLEGRVKSLRALLKHAEGERDYWLREHDELGATLATGRGAVAEATEALGRAAATQAAIVEAAEALLEQSFVEVAHDIQQAVKVGTAKLKLRATLKHKSKAAAKLLSRLATLDAAEAALADCGIGGIYAEFDGLADAIEQMAEYIGDPERCMRQEAGRRNAQLKKHLADARRVAGLWFRRAQEAKLAAHVNSKTCDELMQIAHTEEVIADGYLRQLRTEQQLRIEMGQRATRAEALAALVATEETATLLERLGRPWYEVPTTRVKDDFTTARKLAAQIREALGDS